MDAKYLEAHRALEKKLAAVNADARKLLASGANISTAVHRITEAGEIITHRCKEIAEHLDTLAAAELAKENPSSLPTKEVYLAEFSKLDAAGLSKVKAEVEAALEEQPDYQAAKNALAAVNELQAKK